MKKIYPYLQDSYYEDANSAIVRRDFLSNIDNMINQKQYVRITLLNKEETPIKEIQGEISTGTLSKDGSSSVRKTCSLTLSVSGGEYTVEDGEMDFALNKKIFLEIGIKNTTNQYLDYPILWFPQGVFYIGDFSISSSATSAVTISLKLKDKMCGLNGDVGGTFPSTTILDELDTQSPSGAYVTEKVLIYDILVEILTHFGEEDINNIVIEDVPKRIQQVLQWTGSNPLYLIPNGGSEQSGDISYEAQLEKPDEGVYYLTFNYGEDVGYMYADFVWTGGELTAAAGDSVVTILDKIKNLLGNYEYYYDEFGVFHFREIKNYLNTSQGKILLDDMNKNDYLVEVNAGKSLYTFSDKSNLISINATPNYSNIKNDYIVHGIRKMTGTDISYDVMYHLAIDEKPDVTDQSFSNFLLYKEESTSLVKGFFPVEYSELPEVGDFNIIYKDQDAFYFWDGSAYKEVEKIQYYEEENPYRPKDWRTLLYIQGLLGIKNGTDQGYYFPELQNGWPLIYDLEKQIFYGQDDVENFSLSNLTNGNYFLDFIDPSETYLGQFSVKNIGRRTNVSTNEDINCLFQPEIPNIVFINIDDEEISDDGITTVPKALVEECLENGQPYSQVKGDIFWAMATGGYKNGAFDQIKYDLYLHTSYQRTVSLTSIPIFYLEPNNRITISDNTTRTYGDFVLQNISTSLGAGAIMSISGSESVERF